MTLGEIVKGKSYPYIEYRGINEVREMFFGVCKSENGKLIGLDGDSYSEEYTEFANWEEWENDKGEICLTVWESMDFYNLDKVTNNIKEMKVMLNEDC